MKKTQVQTVGGFCELVQFVYVDNTKKYTDKESKSDNSWFKAIDSKLISSYLPSLTPVLYVLVGFLALQNSLLTLFRQLTEWLNTK